MSNGNVMLGVNVGIHLYISSSVEYEIVWHTVSIIIYISIFIYV